MASKPKPAYGDMIDLPDDPGEPVQANESTPVRSYDSTPERHTLRRERPRARAKAPVEPAPKADYIQRSLYAREETFERIRQFAFEKRRPAQELYREGLYLLLKKYKLDEGMSPDDV